MSDQQNHHPNQQENGAHGADNEEELEYLPEDYDGPQEVFLDDADIAELQAQMDEEGDVPMDEDDDEDDVVDMTGDDNDHDREEEMLADTSLRSFHAHNKPIFSISTHPTCPVLAVSGAEDDNGYLWRLDTGEEVAKLSGHTDSVITTGWSADGEMVATGGMDGRVRVWRRVKPSQPGQWEWSRWEFLTVLEGMDEISVRDGDPSKDNC
jgi:WD40 repeat protein